MQSNGSKVAQLGGKPPNLATLFGLGFNVESTYRENPNQPLCSLPQAAVMSPPVDPSVPLHPSTLLAQQMGHLSLGNSGTVRGFWDVEFIPFAVMYLEAFPHAEIRKNPGHIDSQ